MPSEVPIGWVRRELGEIYRNRKEAGRSKLPVMSVTMSDGLVSRDSLDRRVVSGLDPREHLLARKGDLVYNTMRMWQGVSGVAGEDCVVSPAYVICQPTDFIDSNFSGHLMKYDCMIGALRGHSQGLTSDRLRLYFHHFARIRVALPPLPEQKKIAAILSTVDEAIQATQAVIEQTRRVKEGLLQDLLTRGIGHTRFKQTEIGEIPELWEVRRLASLCAIDHGFAFRGEFFTDSTTPYHLLSPGNFSVHGGYQAHKNRFYDGAVDAAFVLSAGDLLVTMTDLAPGCQTLGLPMRVPAFRGYLALHNQRLGRVHILQERHLDIGFLTCFLLSSPYRSRIKNSASGSTVRHTSPTRILASRLPMPPLTEQRKIAAIVSTTEDSIRAAAVKFQHLQKVKSGLLQDLLTGDVRVSV